MPTTSASARKSSRTPSRPTASCATRSAGCSARWRISAPSDAVAHADMPELERLMLHQLAGQAAIVRKAYAEFDYKTVVASLSAFMNTELSAFYFDIRKDTLYCDPPSSLARKAALTTIDIICDAILKWLAPVLSFTTEEAWRMYRPDAEPSVHLTLFPDELRRVPRRRAGGEMGDHPRRPPRRHRRAGSRARRQDASARRWRPRRWSTSPTRRSSTRCSISISPRSASPRTRWRPMRMRRPARSG